MPWLCKYHHFEIPSISSRQLLVRKRKWLLRWQSIFDLHVRNVVVQGDRDHLFHGADEAIFFTPIFNNQGIGLMGVKHDIVGSDDHDTSNHTLQKELTEDLT